MRTGERRFLQAAGWPLVIFGECFAVLAIFRFRRLSADSFVSLVGGREVANHGLPQVDHLTVEGAGRTWIDQQWLAQWMFYRVWQVGGYGAMAALGAVLVASAFALLAAVLFERGAHPRRVVKWTLLAFAVSLPAMALRAQDFAYPLFVLLGWIILRDLRADRPSVRRLVVALALLALWANLHGSVLVGSALFAAYCGSRMLLRRHSPRVAALYLASALVAVAAPLLTPYGLRTARYYDAFLTDSAIRHFSSEWQSVTYLYGIPAIDFFLLVAALAYVLVRGIGRGAHPSWSLVLATAGLVVLGFVSLRWEAWAAIAAVVLATDTLNATAPAAAGDQGKRPRRFELGLGLLAVPAAIVLFTQGTSTFERIAPLRSIAVAARYAQAHPSATILADDRSSTPMLWLHPELAGRVALDDRLEIFAPQLIDDWGDYISGREPAVHRLAARHHVLIASRGNGALAKRLVSLTGWRVLHSGRDGAVVTRN